MILFDPSVDGLVLRRAGFTGFTGGGSCYCKFPCEQSDNLLLGVIYCEQQQKWTMVHHRLVSLDIALPPAK